MAPTARDPVSDRRRDRLRHDPAALAAFEDPAADESALAEAMKAVPRGAIALAGLSVGLLLLAWLALYVLVFLPRGQVG